MQRLWLFCALVLFNFRAGFCDLPGFCLNKIMKTKLRYVLNDATKKWDIQQYSEPKFEMGCCPGYKAGADAKQCTPICDPACTNANCEAPNTCVCLSGFSIINNSTNTCYDTCDSCVNGACHSLAPDAQCVCDPGYEQDKTFKHLCNPVCSPACVNASCTAPSSCECYEGFHKNPDQKNVCIPKCIKQCVFGHCTDPDECTCFDGYINDESSPNICVPVCNQTCEHGFCDRPNSCKCFDGFELHPRNPFQCFPQQPQNSSLNFCELRLPKAMKYSDSLDCILLKENMLIESDSKCQLLQDLWQPTCAQANSCSINQCSFSFRCSTKILNGSKEIHCDLDLDDFYTEDSSNTSIKENEWIDVVLVLNSFVQINSRTTTHNGIVNEGHKWNLRPTSKWAVCGENHFGLEICSSSNGASNPSHVWIISFALVCVIVLFLGGAALYFWLRIRKIDYTVNYREDMMRGFSNQGYDDRPSELLTLDDNEPEDDSL